MQHEMTERKVPGAVQAANRSSLPSLRTQLCPAELLERLRVASRRGRLPGFEAQGGSAFTVAAHGHPFDGVLLGRCEPDHAGHATCIRFELRLLHKMPIFFALIIAASVWPGVYFMDELVAQIVPGLWRPWVTYYWYLPLTILPVPFVWRSIMSKSRRTMWEHADETIRGIAKEINAATPQAGS